jgi:hypothetical protein
MVYYYCQSLAAKIVSRILTEARYLFPAAASSNFAGMKPLRETPVGMVDAPTIAGRRKWFDR